jgi:von Willebrand factor type A domain/Aerotolerance regulator N-terminal
MDLLNLTLGQFLAVFVPLAGGLVALYFYDRSRRRLVVSTLRFWPRRPAPPKTRRHKKLQQPLSLLLQVLAMLLLLLAVADLRFGSFGGPLRHHVLILETSAWMNATAGGGNGILMDEARARAAAYLRAIPANEPVMLIRADGLPTPATPFTTDRDVLLAAIRDSQAGFTAANLGGALELARSALDLATSAGSGQGLLERMSAGTVGEVALVGTASVLRRDAAQIRTSGIPRLRLIEVGEGTEDAGIRQFTAHRSAEEPGRWRVVAQVANHSRQAKTLRLDVRFNSAVLGYRTARIGAESEQALEFTVRTQSPGVLEAVLGPSDVLAGDNTARLELPAYQPRPLEVFSDRAAKWRPLAASIPSVEPSFRRPAEYGDAAGERAVRVLDHFVPREAVEGAAVFVAPPKESSPIHVAREVSNVRITRWGTPHPLAGGLNDADFLLARAEVFELSAGDVMIAECAAGPVIVLREQGGRRDVFVGFDLLDEKMQGRLSTPLLFANIVRWFAPEVFRGEAVQASAPGLIEWDMPPVREQDVQVVSSQDAHIPWRLVDDRLRLFAGAPGVVTIRTPEQESRLSLTLPEVGDARWEPPEGTLRGVPPPARGALLAGVPLWPWLSLLALAILAVDWRYYGRGFTETAVAVEGTLEPAASAGLTGLGLGNGAGRSREREEQLTR